MKLDLQAGVREPPTMMYVARSGTLRPTPPSSGVYLCVLRRSFCASAWYDREVKLFFISHFCASDSAAHLSWLSSCPDSSMLQCVCVLCRLVANAQSSILRAEVQLSASTARLTGRDGQQDRRIMWSGIPRLAAQTRLVVCIYRRAFIRSRFQNYSWAAVFICDP